MTYLFNFFLAGPRDDLSDDSQSIGIGTKKNTKRKSASGRRQIDDDGKKTVGLSNEPRHFKYCKNKRKANLETNHRGYFGGHKNGRHKQNRFFSMCVDIQRWSRNIQQLTRRHVFRGRLTPRHQQHADSKNCIDKKKVD